MRCKNSACRRSDVASDIKFTYPTVCREITKADSDTQSKPSDSFIYNTGTETLPVNQWNFNLSVLPRLGWGVRGRILLKIKKFLTFGSVLMREFLYPARLLYEVKNES